MTEGYLLFIELKVICFCLHTFKQISKWSSPAPAMICSPDSSIIHCTIGSDLANRFRPEKVENLHFSDFSSSNTFAKKLISFKKISVNKVPFFAFREVFSVCKKLSQEHIKIIYLFFCKEGLHSSSPCWVIYWSLHLFDYDKHIPWSPWLSYK